MTNLRQAAQQALEAMESFESGTGGLYAGEFAKEIADLRAALAEPESKPLKPEHILDISDATESGDYWHLRFARAIEAAHGIKDA